MQHYLASEVVYKMGVLGMDVHGCSFGQVKPVLNDDRDEPICYIEY